MYLLISYAASLDTVPTNVLCIGFIALVVLTSLTGLFIYELWIGGKILPHANEVVGIIFGAISLLYSLILAFIILAVWDNYVDLNKTIASEADRLNSIVAHSATLPSRIQHSVKTALFSYCHQVIEKEWGMQQPDVVGTPSAIPNLRLLLLQVEPGNEREEIIYTVLDEDLSGISDLRRTRLSYRHSQVPELFWFILKGGSCLLIVFYYFLQVSSVRRKRLYLGFLSSYIAMCLFLVYTLDRPFIGSMQVSRQPYENILMILSQDKMITQIK